MPDPTTTNKGLAIPLRGSDVGVWDTPVNGNMSIIDNSFGGIATVPLINTPVTLSAAQYQCAFITFTGVLTANVTITFPAVGSFYTVQNLTSNTSAFQVTLATTAIGSQYIGCPWGEAIDIFTDGANVKFRSLAHQVGGYWDFAGSSVPAWVSACAVPPYLNCDGTSFSSATYPILFTIMGGNTLPDARGRARFALNQGTGRITATGGLDGNTLVAGGGAQTVTLSSQNMPPIPVTDPGHTHTTNAVTVAVGAGLAGAANSLPGATIDPAFTGITAGNAVPTAFGVVPPGYVGGITLIRSA